MRVYFRQVVLREVGLFDACSQLVQLTIDLTEKVVRRNIDRESNAALVEDYISSIGRAN